MTYFNDFLAIESELQKRRAQHEKVRGKETPFRCVFKTQCGWAYTYHENYEDADNAEYNSAHYNIMGRGYLSRGKKLKIETQGPRGGWKKCEKESA